MAVGIAGLHLPISGRSRQYWTSSASTRSQWVLPGFICQLQIVVGITGLQPQTSDRSGHCRTSTASPRSQWALPDFSRDCQIAVGTAGLEPQLPDRNGHAGLQPQAPDLSGYCRTSAASLRSQTTDKPPTPISLRTDAVDFTSNSLSPPQTTIPTIPV
eukprot:s1350_g23.t1